MNAIISFLSENWITISYFIGALVVLSGVHQIIEKLVNERKEVKTRRKMHELWLNASRIGFKEDSLSRNSKGEIIDLTMEMEFGDGYSILLMCTHGVKFMPYLYMVSAQHSIDSLSGKVIFQGSAAKAIRSAVRELLDDFLYAGKICRDKIPERLLES